MGNRADAVRITVPMALVSFTENNSDSRKIATRPIQKYTGMMKNDAPARRFRYFWGTPKTI